MYSESCLHICLTANIVTFSNSRLHSSWVTGIIKLLFCYIHMIWFCKLKDNDLEVTLCALGFITFIDIIIYMNEILIIIGATRLYFPMLETHWPLENAAVVSKIIIFKSILMLDILLFYCKNSSVNVSRPHTWLFKIGLGNSVVPSGNRLTLNSVDQVNVNTRYTS